MNEDEIYCIPTYMVNDKIKNYTRNLIKFLKERDKKVLLISHYFIPVEFQELVDFCIYDNRNDLLYENRFKGRLYYFTSAFDVSSQEFILSNSSLACYYFHSALFFSKFINKRIVHFVDYDSVLRNLDIYDDNYKTLKSSDFTSVRYKNENDSYFADTSSVDLSKINLNDYIKSKDELLGLLETDCRFEEFFSKNFLSLENPLWKSKEELKKSIDVALENVNATDWICLASSPEDRLYLIVIAHNVKNYRIIIDEDIIEKNLPPRHWWIKEVSNNKNILIYDDKNKILKAYHIPLINIKENAEISSVTFK